MKKGQEEIRSQLLQLHNVISGTKMTCEEIVQNRKIAPYISLSHHTELSGMVASGSRVSVEKYGTLGDKLDYGTAKGAR
jgi:hypothetical protein